jgi:magnesium transporter
MRLISAWVAILAIPTVLAAIYGMNFETMPELGWKYGYEIAIGAMLLLCLLAFVMFWHWGWLRRTTGGTEGAPRGRDD